MCRSLLLNRRLKKGDQKCSFLNSNCNRQFFFFFFLWVMHMFWRDACPVVKVHADKFDCPQAPTGCICSTKQAYCDGGVLLSVICYGVDMLGVGEGFTWHCTPFRLETQSLHYRISDCICSSGGSSCAKSHSPEQERWSLFLQLLWQVVMHSIAVGSLWPVVSF